MKLTFTRDLLALSLIVTSSPFLAIFSRALDMSSDTSGGVRAWLSARDPMGLLQTRDDGCSSVGLSSDYQSCGMGLPNNFCCNTKAGDRCMPFNNNQSVVCCPKGTDCNNFYQIGCQAQGLNVTAPGNANSSIHSTLINGGLVTCSTGNCCPLGFLCASDGSNLCQPANSSSTSTSSGAAATLSSAPSAAASSLSGSSSSSQKVSDDNQCPAFPTVAVLVGFFPGMILGMVLTIIIIVLVGRKTRKNREANIGSDSPMSSQKPYGHIPAPSNRQVSEPIMQDSGATRVDFLRRMSKHRNARSPTNSSQSAASTPGARNSARVRSLFSGKSRGPGDDIPEVPSTPMSRIKREPSTETINVFSPPNLEHEGGYRNTGMSSQTRWDDVMEGAGGLGVKGLAAPPAFLGSPGMVDPRKRGLDGSANGFERKTRR